MAHSRNGISSELLRQKKELSADNYYGNLGFGPRLLLMMEEGSRSSSAQLLSTLRQLRDSLVGDEKAKDSALELGVVEDLLSLLDAAAAASAGDSDAYEPALFQTAVGVFSILGSFSANAAETYLTPNSPRIAQHIARALEYPSERLTATALRAIISLFCSHAAVPSAGSSPPPAAEAGQRCTAATLSVPLLLRKVSGRILDEVTTGESWTEGVKSLGVQALAALTRDADLAGSLVPGVCSKGAALLAPILPAHR